MAFSLNFKSCSQDEYLEALARAKAAGLKRAAARPFAEKLRSLEIASRFLEDTLMEALPTALEKLMQAFAAAVRAGEIRRYALAGAFAIIYYGAPIHTVDADFLVIFPQAVSGLLNPSSLFDYFKRQGAQWDGEHLVLNGLQFQLIPANEGLNAEALATAQETPDGFWVVDLEHLIALKLSANRPKDRLHVEHLLASGATPDTHKLNAILQRHGLKERWAEIASGH